MRPISKSQYMRNRRFRAIQDNGMEKLKQSIPWVYHF